jgi:hypothetical protein
MTSTDNINDLINLVWRTNDSNELFSLLQRANGLIANSHNEISADKITDLISLVRRKAELIANSHKETSTDDTGNVATIQSFQDNTSSNVTLIIHNRSPGIELISPVYADRHATCYLSPDQRVYAGSTVQVSFNIDLFLWGEPIGILMYKLHGKNTDQSNEEAISSEYEATCVQFVIIWKINRSKKFLVASHLIEHDKDRVWDRVELMKLTEYYKLYDIQHAPTEETYLIYDNTVLMTKMNATHEEDCYKLEMTISEASINEDTQRLRYIGLDG